MGRHTSALRYNCMFYQVITMRTANCPLQVTDAKLQDKNKGMIIDVADDIVELCASAVEDNNTQKQTRVAAGETLTTAQKSKAVLVTYRNVGNINAETVLSRTRDLHILYNILSP